jgi:hypothetical protein
MFGKKKGFEPKLFDTGDGVAAFGRKRHFKIL